ncbi:MAG: endonuclease/exonuclease/phosphatase family protein [Thermoguttaceae bacterium]
MRFTTLFAVLFSACMFSNILASEVRVLSINVRCSTASDGENRWEKRKDFLLDVVKEGDYDFIGGQEVIINPNDEINQIKFLADNLPDYNVLYLCREKDPKNGEGSPVLYKKNRWKLDPKENGTFWLSDTPEEPGSVTWEGQSSCPRVCTGGLFHEIDTAGKETGKSVYVYSTHFDHVGETARQKAAALIMERIEKQRGAKNVPVILVGDFNCGENSPAIRFIKGETVSLDGQEKVPPMKLVDTFREVKPEEKSVATFHAFRGPKLDATGKIEVGEKIDYIFVTPDIKTISAEIIRTNKNRQYPTDHYPISATVQIEP